MISRPTILVALLALAACAAPESGIRDPAAFMARAERTVVASNLPPLTLARCFQETATLLPSSSLLNDADGQGATYTLRGFEHSFEQILFRPAASGSTATLLLAPGVNDRWRADLERDRLAPLRACAG